MYKEDLEHELQTINEMIAQMELKVKNAPAGRLTCAVNKGKYPQYYRIFDGKDQKHPKKRYMRKREAGTIERLAQKEYDEKFLEVLIEEKSVLEKLYRQYDPMEKAETIFEKLPRAKQILVKPYYLNNADFVEEWYKKRGNKRNTIEMEQPFLTNRGEHVRSKSEKMIADLLDQLKIPYVYEAPLRLMDGNVWFPDFTILNVRTRQTIYHEHFGLADDPKYCSGMIKKIETYAANEIYLGKNFYMTMESSMRHIDMQYMEMLAKRFYR